MKAKIRIQSISDEVHSLKGFDHRGCFGCHCPDACCSYGADFDHESFELVMKWRHLIEPVINKSLDECFEEEWSGDHEYLGNNARRSKVDQGKCIFKIPDGKGCILYRIAINNEISLRLIPSICRLYPLTWNHGRLEVYSDIEPHCNCLEKINISSESIFTTQKSVIEDVFEFDAGTDGQ